MSAQATTPTDMTPTAAEHVWASMGPLERLNTAGEPRHPEQTCRSADGVSAFLRDVQAIARGESYIGGVWRLPQVDDIVRCRATGDEGVVRAVADLDHGARMLRIAIGGEETVGYAHVRRVLR